MDLIRQRFLQAEQDFLIAARSKSGILGDFAERWQALQSDWESCHHEADPSTQRLVSRVAARIEELAGDFLVFESRSLSLEDDLLNSLQDVFSSLTLEESAPTTGSDSDQVPRTPPSPSPGSASVSPSQWLLRNLHNPYPLSHVQFSIDRTPGSKHVRDWFSKARQRIGWTRLLRDRFAGCRSLAIEAAFRAFVRDDPNSPLDKDLKTAFLAIKFHAEFVYGDEDTTPLPSPKRLRSISPTPSLTFSSGSEDSDDERCSISSPENTFTRPLKRASPDSPDSSSPKRRRCDEPASTPEVQTQDYVSLAHIELSSLRPKKRRLSESDSDSPRPKRPRGMEDGRLHAVSDPLTASTTPTWFDFDRSFQIPNPASTSPLDSSSFDLDFFNPLSLSSYAVSSIPTPSPNLAVPVDFSLFEIPQLDLSQPGLPTFDSDWSEFLNFEPNSSLFPYSPSLASSLASTPPFVDDTILSSSTPPDTYPPNPNPLLDILPHLNEKGVRFPAVGEPIIQGQDFLFPPGEDAGISSVTALLLAH